LDEVKAWMDEHFLKFKESIRLLLFVGMPMALHNFNSCNLITDCDLVTPSSQVYNLAVIFDPKLILNNIKMALRNITRLQP